jgi:hypothetical protein
MGRGADFLSAWFHLPQIQLCLNRKFAGRCCRDQTRLHGIPLKFERSAKSFPKQYLLMNYA